MVEKLSVFKWLPLVHQESSLEELFVVKSGRHTEKQWNPLCKSRPGLCSRSWRQAFAGLAGLLLACAVM